MFEMQGGSLRLLPGRQGPAIGDKFHIRRNLPHARSSCRYERRLGRLTTIASWVFRTITTTASWSAEGFSSR
jgi:hypothetical protein